MSAGSFTVHGSDLEPERVRFGDALRRQVAPERRPRSRSRPPCTSLGTEPPCSRERRDPRATATAPSPSACTVSLFAVSIVRHAVAIVRRELLHLDQRAPVERLHASTRCVEACLANRIDDEPRERRRVGRVVRRSSA